MSRRKRPKREEPRVALVEDAVLTARNLPASLWAIYFIGTVPFVVGFILFWADMAQHAYAFRRVAIEAAGLTLLFIWMKVWQAEFSRRVLRRSSDIDPPRTRISGLIGTAIDQTIVQGASILLLPFTIFLVFPIPYQYAFSQTFAAIDPEEVPELRVRVRRAFRAAFRDQSQNLTVVWLLSPFMLFLYVFVVTVMTPIQQQFTPEWSDFYFAFTSVLIAIVFIPLGPVAIAVALNIGTAIVFLPALLRILTGIDTVFTANPSLLMESTPIVAICALTYLALDPFSKVAYALRLFRLESRKTGADLKLRIRLIAAATTVVLAALLVGSSEAHAQDAKSAPAVSRLDESLDRTLENPRYAWQLPRERPESTIPFMDDLAESAAALRERIMDALRVVRDWWTNLWNRDPNRQGGTGAPSRNTLQLSIGALVVALLALLFLLLWRGRRGRSEFVNAVPATAAAPNLEDEDTTADALPEDEWIALAEQLMAQGDLRLAMRALFFSALAALSRNGFVTIARYKTNREYVRELRRVAHAAPELAPRFGEQVGVFESVWYGDHSLSPDGVARYRESLQKVKEAHA